MNISGLYLLAKYFKKLFLSAWKAECQGEKGVPSADFPMSCLQWPRKDQSGVRSWDVILISRVVTGALRPPPAACWDAFAGSWLRNRAARSRTGPPILDVGIIFCTTMLTLHGTLNPRTYSSDHQSWCSLTNIFLFFPCLAPGKYHCTLFFIWRLSKIIVIFFLCVWFHLTCFCQWQDFLLFIVK